MTTLPEQPASLSVPVSLPPRPKLQQRRELPVEKDIGKLQKYIGRLAYIQF